MVAFDWVAAVVVEYKLSVRALLQRRVAPEDMLAMHAVKWSLRFGLAALLLVVLMFVRLVLVPSWA